MRYLSLCSGIEAASEAWKHLNWNAVGFSEIEPFCCELLRQRYPQVPNLGDMREIDGEKYHGTVELVVGGTPCQDFSIAGKRAGLQGERSGLAMQYVALVSQIRPRWLVWENVPGAMSTGDGRDFGCFLKELDKLGYGLCWRVLDAQYFGVPQRRRRIFLVGYLGDWRPAAAVLFEPESLCGDTAPRRKTGTDVAGTLKGGSGKRGWETGCECTYIPFTSRSHWEGGPHPTLSQSHNVGGIGMSDQELFCQGGAGLVPEYCPRIVEQAMSCKWSKGTSGPAGDEYHNLVCSSLTTRPYADNAAQEDKLIVSQYGDKAAALTAEGADASPCADRGPTVIYAVRTAQTSSNGWGVHEDTSYTLDGANGQAVVSFHGSQDPSISGNVTHPLGRNQGQECCIALHPHCIGRKPENGPQRGDFRDDGVGYTMDSTGVSQAVLVKTPKYATQAENIIAVQQNQAGEVRVGSKMGSMTTNSSPSSRNTPMILHQVGQHMVRRLTPMECERLQGFPDGYTAIEYHGRPASDGSRYKALGNSMAVPVMRWIGERIAEVDRIFSKGSVGQRY